MEADRQAAGGEAAGERNAANPGQVGADGVEVNQVHRDRVVGLLAQLEGGRGRDRAADQVNLLEGLKKILPDQPSHPQGLRVIGVVIAGREGVGTKHDSPLDLRPEALGAAAAVHLDQRRVEAADATVVGLGCPVPAVAIVSPVIASKIARCLARGNEVVSRHAVGGVGQFHLVDRRPGSLVGSEGVFNMLSYLGVESVAIMGSDPADLQPGQRLVEFGSVSRHLDSQ